MVGLLDFLDFLEGNRGEDDDSGGDEHSDGVGEVVQICQNFLFLVRIAVGPGKQHLTAQNENSCGERHDIADVLVGILRVQPQSSSPKHPGPDDSHGDSRVSGEKITDPLVSQRGIVEEGESVDVF